MRDENACLGNLRHKSGSESLEEGSDGDGETREVRAKTSAEGKDTSEQGQGSEEESDQVESEHEARQVVVMVSSDECSRNALSAAKVLRGVERQSRDGRTAVCVEAILNTADVEEGPTRGVARSGSACRVDLNEVGLVEGSGV